MAKKIRWEQIESLQNLSGYFVTYNSTDKKLNYRLISEAKEDLGFRNNLNTDGTGFNFPSTDAVNAGLNLRVPYTGATQDLQLADKNLVITTGQIQLNSGNAKMYSGRPLGSSSVGLILWGYDGIEFANRSYYNSPTIFTMNGVEKARVQYNGDFKNEGVLLPQKGIIVKGFSPIVKQGVWDGGGNTTTLIFIKTGFGENYYNVAEFKVILKAYSTSGIKHYEFIISNFFVRDSVTNYYPTVTWVAGNSTDITAIKFYKKDSGGYESYVAIEGSFVYPEVAITEAQAISNTLHADYWSIDFAQTADLTGKSVTHTFLPNDFKRDKTWLDANYANQSWVTTQLGNYLTSQHLSGRSISDANDADATGIMAHYAGGTNIPSGSVDGSLFTLSYSNTWSTQLYGDWRTKDLYFRTQENTSWKTWAKLWHSDNFNPNDYIPISQKGVANGVATLGADGLIPSTQLPSYVDDVLEFNNLTSFPTTGEIGKIYVALDTNLTYRWGGSSYIQIASGAVQSVNGQTGVVNLTYSDVGAEQAFTKNTAFNKNFGTTSGTVAQGDDSRILNGQTAYNWGNHADAGYAVSGWVYSNFQSLNNNLTGISDLNLTNSSVGLIKKISGPPGSNNWALDTSVYATESWTSTNYFPKSNLHGINITNTGGGAWINMPTGGYSAIGSGGQGVDTWIAKTVSNGQFFTDAIAGDLISRNTTGKIMWGNSISYSAMYLQNNILTFLNTPKVGNNDIYHSGNFSLNGYATQTWVNNIFIPINQFFDNNYAGHSTMISSALFGNESGLVDGGFERSIASTDGIYYRYGSSLSGFEGLNVNPNTNQIGYGCEPTAGYRHQFEGDIMVSEGITCSIGTGEEVYNTDGNLLGLTHEIKRDPSTNSIRLNRYVDMVSGSSNSFATDIRDVHVTMLDGGNLTMDDIFPMQRITITNAHPTASGYFTVNGTSIGVNIPAKATAEFVVHTGNKMVQLGLMENYGQVLN